MRLAIALGVLCAVCSRSSAGEAFKGTVVHVADGDTITVLHERREVRVRLAEIDSPERGQAFGKKARDATAALTIGQTVTVVVEGRDRYRRILAEVLLPDGTSLNRRLRRLAELEAEARVAKRGSRE